MEGLVSVRDPHVPLVREVLHADVAHEYPAHVHDAWTLMTLDAGSVSDDLDGRRHLITTEGVTILPPGVAHTGRPGRAGERYRKRVLYLEPEWLDPAFAARAARQPTLSSRDVAAAVGAVRRALGGPQDAAAAEFELVRLAGAVGRELGAAASAGVDAVLARRYRDLLDARLAENVTLAEAAAALGAAPARLARSFTAAYRIPPHQYVSTRRVDLARRLLVHGTPAASAAALAGFHDQSHMTRQFRRVLGCTPGVFATPRRLTGG